jgi:hypothetical protein
MVTPTTYVGRFRTSSLLLCASQIRTAPPTRPASTSVCQRVPRIAEWEPLGVGANSLGEVEQAMESRQPRV